MKVLSPLKAIRAKCLDCCCNQVYEINRCHIDDCALYPFREGKNPNRAGIMSDEHKAALKQGRESKKIADIHS